MVEQEDGTSPTDNWELIQGKDLKVGDTLDRSWDGSGNRVNTIARKWKYNGPLAHLWPQGAWVVDFHKVDRWSCSGSTLDFTAWLKVRR